MAIYSTALRFAAITFFLMTLISCGGMPTSSGAKNAYKSQGSPTLSWSAPQTFTNGSPISRSYIKGYKVYFRNSSQRYYTLFRSFFVPAPATSLNIDTLNLLPGTYYFVVTTIDHSNMESDFSNEVQKDIMEQSITSPLVTTVSTGEAPVGDYYY